MPWLGQTEREAAQERASDLAYEAHQERMREAYEADKEEEYRQERVAEGEWFHGLVGGTNKALEEIELKSYMRQACIDSNVSTKRLVTRACDLGYEIKPLAQVTQAPSVASPHGDEEVTMVNVGETLRGVHFTLPDGKRVMLDAFYYETKKRDARGFKLHQYLSVEALRMLKLADVHADLALAIKMSEDPDPPWKFDGLRDGAFPRLVWFGEPVEED